MIAFATAVALCGALGAQSPQQRPPRDPRPRPTVSRGASISGTVTSDEAQPRKLRRVRVTLNGNAMERGGRTVITDDDGRYRFTGLAPGQYGLIATKEGYISARYGGSGRPVRGNIRTTLVTGLSIRTGEDFTADLRLAPGAVITGVVTDADGRPEEGLLVAAYSYQLVPGTPERRLSPASAFLRTDDRGVYRIYGLRAGEYVISAQRATAGAEPALHPSTTDARVVVATPVYFPSATDVTAATWIKLAAGDERTGVDIQMRYVPTATITGVLPMPEGSTFGRVALARATLKSTVFESVLGTTTQRDGTFSLPNVAAGHYTLHALTQGPASGGGPPNATAAGSIDIDVNGDDLTGVSIPMSSAFSISGTFVFDGAAPPDVRLGRMSLPIARIGAYPGSSPYFQPLDDTHFTITGVLPGTYRAAGAAVPGVRAPMGKWWLKSIVISGREALDAPVDIRQPTDDVVVTLGDQASAVSGIARDPRGSAVPGVYVVIFAASRASWFPNSRRIAAVRTDAQGRYTIRNLPPGDYLAAIGLDLDQGEWFDPDVLQGLLMNATPLTITGVEAKTVDLTLR